MPTLYDPHGTQVKAENLSVRAIASHCNRLAKQWFESGLTSIGLINRKGDVVIRNVHPNNRNSVFATAKQVLSTAEWRIATKEEVIRHLRQIYKNQKEVYDWQQTRNWNEVPPHDRPWIPGCVNPAKMEATKTEIEKLQKDTKKKKQQQIESLVKEE
ncbi:MAG: hypothetical protein DRH24_08805 [Deltaproteobacteria bacterium]|nr:MAG: hypothetical protein DRH24_08805 [Deltaproteobacteria bacterium]